MLFASLQVPAALRRRVLHLGVLAACGGFIAAGGALITHIGWIFYVRSGSADRPGRNLAVRGLRRVLPVTGDYAGHRFFVRVSPENPKTRKIMATPLFVALVAIEVTDLVFALDSIRARSVLRERCCDDLTCGLVCNDHDSGSGDLAIHEPQPGRDGAFREQAFAVPMKRGKVHRRYWSTRLWRNSVWIRCPLPCTCSSGPSSSSAPRCRRPRLPRSGPSCATPAWDDCV